MFPILNRYLFLNKCISVPGLGSIFLETSPAIIDASTRSLVPPGYQFRFDKFSDVPDKILFSYLSLHSNMTDYEALRLYNEFAFDLRDKLNFTREVSWDGLGILRKDDNGEVHFESTLAEPFFLKPVSAEKVVRPNAKHMMLVGDRERSNREMSEWFAEEPVHGNTLWWLVALIGGIVAVMVIMFHFSNHGWNVGSTGNQQLIRVTK
jgi:CCDC81-like prokaryotic HU domain 1